MRVIEVTAHGGPEVLRLANRPDPEAASDELVVRVRAANINPTDLAARQGLVFGEPPEIPYVLGWDFAGEVVSCGSDVVDFKEGDRVVGMIPWYEIGGSRGAYAELVAVKTDWTVKLPAELDFKEACTIPLNSLTAAQALDLLAAPSGSQILITGASGAVGSFAVQLAVKNGLRVTAVAGRDDEEWVKSLGAEKVLPRTVDYKELERFQWVFDAVPVGDPLLPAVEDGGRIITTRPTNKAEPSRNIHQEFMLIKGDKARMEELVNMVARGELKTRVSKSFPLEKAAEAHELYEKGGHKGKIILLP